MTATGGSPTPQPPTDRPAAPAPAAAAAAPGWRRRRLRRRLLRLGGFTLLLLAVVEVTGYAITGRVAEALVRGPNAGRTFTAGDDPSPGELRELGVDRQFRVDAGPPPASLSVWVLEPGPPAAPAPKPAPRGTLLLLHGHLDRKEQLRDTGLSFAAAGYRVVLMDMRSRGHSGGRFLTFGFREARDASQVLDALQSQGLVSGPVGVFGRSYGGATGIQLAAVDPRVRAVVALSSFSSMRQAVHDASRAVLPAPVRLLLGWRIDPIVDRAGAIAGFDPDEASPLRAITRTRAAVLLMHGTADGYIPPENSRRLHEAAPGHSDLVLIEDKDHSSVMDEESQPVVVRAALDWFGRYLLPGS